MPKYWNPHGFMWFATDILHEDVWAFSKPHSSIICMSLRSQCCICESEGGCWPDTWLLLVFPWERKLDLLQADQIYFEECRPCCSFTLTLPAWGSSTEDLHAAVP